MIKVFLREKKISGGRKVFISIFTRRSSMPKRTGRRAGSICGSSSMKSRKTSFSESTTRIRRCSAKEFGRKSSSKCRKKASVSSRSRTNRKAFSNSSSKSPKAKETFAEQFRQLELRLSIPGRLHRRRMPICRSDAAILRKIQRLSARKQKLSQNTASNYFDKFKVAVRSAFENKMLSTNPAFGIKSIKLLETQREFLTLEELQKLAKTPFERDELRRAALLRLLRV